VIALNALYKILLRSPHLVKVALLKDALVVVGEVIDQHNPNGLVRDAAKQLMGLLTIG